MKANRSGQKTTMPGKRRVVNCEPGKYERRIQSLLETKILSNNGLAILVYNKVKHILYIKVKGFPTRDFIQLVLRTFFLTILYEQTEAQQEYATVHYAEVGDIQQRLGLPGKASL